MEVYHFSEQPYPQAWGIETDSLRVTFPNRHCDPQIAAREINHRLDEWELCDRLGINIMINEHHSTATCLSASATIPLAMLARATKNVRLLGLGFPIANRPDPIRLAEEIAYIDTVSRGRLDVGFVKAAPFELSPANANPGRFMERFWDTHDLLLKALSERDGPFNWESEFHHFRQVNIWPRPYQDPHPPVWVTAQSHGSTTEIARRGHTLAVFLAGWNLRKLYDTYREVSVDSGFPDPAPNKFAYMALMGVGETEEEGHRRAYEIQGYLRTTGIVGEGFMNPPGYMDVFGNMMWLQRNQVRGRAGHHYPAARRDGSTINQATAPIRDLVDAAVCFSGTPAQVAAQIEEFHDHVGGMGNLIVMCHGGEMSHEDAVANLTLFGEEVLPKVRDLSARKIGAAA